MLGCVVQSVTCLTVKYVSDCRSRGSELDPGPILLWRLNDHEIISTTILLPSADSRLRVVVSYKQKYVHEVLVNCLVNLAQEKSQVR